jgi:hypothetical protein
VQFRNLFFRKFVDDLSDGFYFVFDEFHFSLLSLDYVGRKTTPITS